MSCPMVTWCVAGSPATPSGINTSRTSRRGGHGDGISGQRVWISCANKPRTNLTSNYWCKVVPDTGAF